MYKKVKYSYFLDSVDRLEIRKFIAKNDMTMEDLCVKLGVEMSTLKAYLFGKRAIPQEKIEIFYNLGLEIKER